MFGRLSGSEPLEVTPGLSTSSGRAIKLRSTPVGPSVFAFRKVRWILGAEKQRLERRNCEARGKRSKPSAKKLANENFGQQEHRLPLSKNIANEERPIFLSRLGTTPRPAKLDDRMKRGDYAAKAARAQQKRTAKMDAGMKPKPTAELNADVRRLFSRRSTKATKESH